MSSPVFPARTSHTDSNPQLCGLTGAHIMEKDDCLFLVCDGQSARPEYQVCQIDTVEYKDSRGRNRSRKVYESKQGRPFRCTWTGEWETYEKADGKKGRRRIYEWQVEGANGSMIPVDVWSNMVHASSALELGFELRTNAKGEVVKTKAFKGDRTQGREHALAAEAENPLLTLAKAGLTDEEAGKVAPAPAPVTVTETVDEGEDEGAGIASDEEDRLDAEALGMTVEQYRKLLAERA
jgi:hypothetical protein